MTKTDFVYDYLREKYADNEAILLSEIQIPDMTEVAIRQQIKKLTDSGRLRRYDTGVYYFPRKTMFQSEGTLSVEEVVRRKYIEDKDGAFGYRGGLYLANRLGLTTQVPAVMEVYSNKATTDYRETQVADMRVVVRKPYVKVTSQNVAALQFLDLLKEVVDIVEVDREELKTRLLSYMKAKKLGFDALQEYLPYYPERIYRNMYEVGLLYGISS